ncbi:MAG: hypothetical protein NT130_02575 [Candidatus Micrarchaeota archaeon]|nr:hypothetical protein [Candidatus Micrarchaeota archaeon]
MKIIKLNHDKFKNGFAKGLVIGLVVLFLCLEILTFIGTGGPLLVAALVLTIWLLPTLFVYREIKDNSERVGLIASHYCVFLLGLLIMLLWLINR